MWEPFTEGARQTVMRAQEEAQAAGSAQIGTEHLLAGLLRNEESLATQALLASGVTLEAVREALRAQPPGSAAVEMVFTPRAKRCIELAFEEARRLQNNSVGVEHLLLGMLKQECGATGLLERLGVSPEQVRTELVSRLPEPPPAPPEREAEVVPRVSVAGVGILQEGVALLREIRQELAEIRRDLARLQPPEPE